MESREATDAAAQLEMVKWHILRSDGQRSGLWGRAAASLGADTLVVAGSTIMLALAGTSSTASRISALVALGCVLTSTGYAANALAVVRNRSAGARSGAPTPLMFSLPETTRLVDSYADFRRVVTSQSLGDQLEGGIAELWRIGLLHGRRVRALHRCVWWLLFSIGALMISAFLSLLPR